MFYRFSTGYFIEADSFEEAKQKYLDKITSETEDEDNWYKCDCLGWGHSWNCPQHLRHSDDPDDIPF